MLNKILVFGGIALGAILIVENMVMGAFAVVFIDNSSSAWLLSMVSIIIGGGIGYGIKGMLENDNGIDDESYDF